MLVSVAVAAAALSAGALAQSTTPLVNQHYEYPDLPYKVDTTDGERGIQVGINECNSTTENQDSMCITTWFNDAMDFCLWGPPELDTVANTEGEMVAWCTREGHGTRLIPEGALQGVQFLRTPHYIQVTGFIDQTQINIEADDEGGELDPHGADQRGNPLGSLMFSTAFGQENTSSQVNGSWITQVIEWNVFMGGGAFCMRACDPAWDGAARQCEHVYDRIGCNYNMPAAYVNGTFESCLSDDAMPVGLYVGDDGVTSTWSQPGEGTAISTLPYTPSIPASSSCTPFSSADVYTVMASGAAASSSATGSSSGAMATITAGTSSAGAAMSSGASNAAASGASSAASQDGTGAAPASHLVSGSGLVGVMTLAMFVLGFVLVV